MSDQVTLLVDVGEGEVDLPKLMEMMVVSLEFAGCGYVTVRPATPADDARALFRDEDDAPIEHVDMMLEAAGKDEDSLAVRESDPSRSRAVVFYRAAKLVRESEAAETPRTEDDGTPD